MRITEEKDNDEIRYNYWIYLFTCLVVMSVPIYIANRDSATQKLDVYTIVFQLVMTFLFSSFGWGIGKRFRLSYLWICFLGVSGYIIPKLLSGISAVLIFGRYDLNFLSFMILASLFGSLVIGIMIFIVSYPIQYLLFRSKASKTISDVD